MFRVFLGRARQSVHRRCCCAGGVSLWGSFSCDGITWLCDGWGRSAFTLSQRTLALEVNVKFRETCVHSTRTNCASWFLRNRIHCFLLLFSLLLSWLSRNSWDYVGHELSFFQNCGVPTKLREPRKLVFPQGNCCLCVFRPRGVHCVPWGKYASVSLKRKIFWEACKIRSIKTHKKSVIYLLQLKIKGEVGAKPQNGVSV